VWPEAGVEVGGPAGTDVVEWSEPGVEVGGPAGVDVGVWPEAGVEVGGPAGVDVGPLERLAESLPVFPELPVPVFPDVPFPGVAPAQNAATPSLPAALLRFLKATLLLLMCPLLAT
jgi:hypothetical protein